jgi:hypothetical protein
MLLLLDMLEHMPKAIFKYFEQFFDLLLEKQNEMLETLDLRGHEVMKEFYTEEDKVEKKDELQNNEGDEIKEGDASNNKEKNVKVIGFKESFAFLLMNILYYFAIIFSFV